MPTTLAKRALVTALLSVATLCACHAKPQDTPPSGSTGPALSDQAAATAADTRDLHEALGAGNEVVRAAGDCDTARPLIADARAKFDEVEPRLRTGAARTTLTNLRRQVDRVAELCP